MDNQRLPPGGAPGQVDGHPRSQQGHPSGYNMPPPTYSTQQMAHPGYPMLQTQQHPQYHPDQYQPIQINSVRTQGQALQPAGYPTADYQGQHQSGQNAQYTGYVPQPQQQQQHPLQQREDGDNDGIGPLPGMGTVHLPHKSSDAFKQINLANSQNHYSPNVVDLGQFAGPSSYGYETSAPEGPPIPSVSIFNRIKAILKIGQIFPKEEDIRINSSTKLPEQDPPSYWCHIFYYELKNRVGEPYKASGEQVIIDGLCAPSDGTRFCLGVLGNVNRNPVSSTARRQIGRGCRIFKEGDSLHLECLSASPIFVQCPLYAEFTGDDLATVYRLPQGTKIRVFDKLTFEELLVQAKNQGYNTVYSLLSMCHIRISYIKGWGEQYRRQTITATPCWVEVQFPEPLQVLDKVLMEMAGPAGEQIHSFT